jgi:predicted DCC family thiol-disulfide oxidoreductase YuxK
MKELDFTDFPPGTVTEYTTLVCLACIFDIFTKQIGLAPRSAYTEIKRYSPTVEELTSRKAVRPFFDSDEKHPRCPYCNAAKRWHARLDTHCIEGVRTTDTPRRKLVKTIDKKKDQFAVIELKSDRRSAFFDWLDTLRITLDLNEQAWLLEATKSYLERKAAKEKWTEVFEGLRAVRPSSRLEDGWERDGSRLFLAPPLYNEGLLVQYLVSRSHEHGGRTLEGRLTLMELIRRMRKGGYLAAHNIEATDQFEIFEKLLDEVAGSGQLKLYYIVDRREFREKVKSVYASYA